MELALKLLVVLGLGAWELWAAVPAGYALGLSPIAVSAATSTGAVLGAVAVTWLGTRVLVWFGKRENHLSTSQRPGLLHRVWHRHGAMGLGLLAPLVTGAPLGVAIGLALGAPPKRLLAWVVVGVVAWTVLLTILGALGLAGAHVLRY